MKKVIGTMFLMAVSAAALMTPAMAATRDQRNSGSAYQTDNRANYGGSNNRANYGSDNRTNNGSDSRANNSSNYHQTDIRTPFETRRDENARLREIRLRNERYSHERDYRHYQFDRENRW